MSNADKTIFEIADDFVLGLLDADEFLHVEARIERDPALAAAVDAARERFLPLDLSAEPIATTDGLWARIEQTLPSQPAVSSKGPAASVTEVTAGIRPASNDNAASRWRLGALLASAACIVLAAGLGWSLSRQAEPMVVAVLLNGAGEPQAIVEDFGNHTANIRLLSDFAVPADKVMQVWTLPTRDIGPVSLGLLQQAHSASLSGPNLPPPHDAQLYEITLEQTGGSPTGRPTGPILVKGFAKLPR